MPTPDEATAQLLRADAVSRLHARDATLWSDDAEHHEVAANRLGWLDVAVAPDGWVGRLTHFERQLHADGVEHVVLAGMGGSSLAPEVFAEVFDGHGRGASLRVLDSTHPHVVASVLDAADPQRTLAIVSSKSGSTEETACFAARAASLLPPERLVAITDAGSQLEHQAREGGWREVFTNPADIGGRYSALSLFGMVPAALLGVDVAAVWRSAAAMLEACRTTSADNPGLRLGAFMAGCAAKGRDKLTLLAPTAVAPLGDWIEQLVAESTGKLGRGVIPIVGEPLDEPEVYGPDRAFVAIRFGADELLGVQTLAEAGHPVLTIDVADATALGGEFVRWEVATALAAVVLGVDPFDEPNVSESKANTKAVLEELTSGRSLPHPERGSIEDLVASLSPGDYLSVQAYLPPTPERVSALQQLRVTVRDRLQVATTLGWGPRFLHSTGQLHKGGPASVVALQLVDSPAGGPDIPGRPYDFATLVRAQALGDLRSLREHGLRVAQVDVSDGLEPVLAAVEAATRTHS